MEDEHTGRIPGSSPVRDVEPFWDEPAPEHPAPVPAARRPAASAVPQPPPASNGAPPPIPNGAPPPTLHGAPPPIPNGAPPPTLHGTPPPALHGTPPTAVPPTAVPPTAVPPTAVPPTAVPPVAGNGAAPPAPGTGTSPYGHTSADSPWAQPPRRPAEPPAPPEPPRQSPVVPPARPVPPTPATHPNGPIYQPGVRVPAPTPAAEPPSGAVYRPGAADPIEETLTGNGGGRTPTAEEFARRRLAPPPQPAATMGPRALVGKGTLGLLKLPPGKRELEYKKDVETVRRNFGGLRQVTVVNPKGGGGKTVATLLLAMTFGQKRGGYVLAWDNNETQGTLGMRAQQDFHARTVRDMLTDLHLLARGRGRVGDLSKYVRAQGEGMFDVLASDESATAGEMLTAEAFAEIRDVVSRFYKLIFVDTGNNVRAENWQAAIDATDQLVITMSARNDSAETAARMLDHLETSGRQRLVRQAVTVVTMPPTRKDIDLPAIQGHFAARTRAVLLAPYERRLDSGEPIRYGALSGNTKDAWLKIAAAVAEGL
ncbi:cobalamin biosynthesis protein CobQ [Actinoplanes teichomyceticus]|uniref:MinD-like ATPase involved in chromosome partitioning or flagellar assembly n=1 Tax=Actinoplanes teichomyceticus TaxID=1867 RepID=A0A561WRU8_ACTTI|nr:cobalamin biosynthesis protein CobQ [Actinoplanes teichomyceticus]TWG26564.1 MinD-like ATPase involved in chromosome partitioning or flagellar assembly [Actinoplanes teichomyceticus]GIF16952.1 hypothetical protein Ate01nite_69840 [Actinoplanes teichomyceticus]